MSNTIQDLKSFLGSGARTNRYEVQFHPIAGLGFGSDLANIGAILAKASSFPGKTIQTSEAFLRGRKTMLQGMTDYGNTWDVTFYDTVEHKARTWFLLWMSLMDDDVLDMHNHSYISSANITQLDGNGDSNFFGGAYTLLNTWPQAVSEMSVDSSEANTIGTFTVTFAFDRSSRSLVTRS